jgi:methyl-accepting chemotaxis protein
MWFNIRSKVLVTFGIIVLLVAGLGLYQFDALNSIRGLSERIVENDIRVLNEVNDVTLAQQQAKAAAERLRDAARLSALGNDPGGKAAAIGTWQEARTQFGQALENVSDLMQAALDQDNSATTDLRLRQLIYEIAAAIHLNEQIGPVMQLQLDALGANNFTTAEEHYAQANQLRDQVAEKLRGIRDIVIQFVNEGRAEIERAHHRAVVALIAAFAGIVVVGSAATWLLQRAITGPLRRFAQLVERIGDGDLTQEVKLTSRDEMSVLAGHLNAMVAGLRDLTSQSRAVSDSLNSATVEIRASTQQQAASVEEQLASVQETSATLDEITQSGAQISQRAQDLSSGSEETLRASSNGLQAVEDTARVMDAIREQAESVAENIVTLSEKTQAVGDIIATVNDISERSHILALNAAIEAAAAGEHGRSFAVVAAEIKNLADQSKEATVQVRAVLGDIQRGINTSVMLTEEAVKRVASGKEQTDTAQRTINDLTDSIQESTDTFEQIVAAINQQHIGLEQVMIALRNIRQASTQTADGTRQLDAAAANLSALSTQLAHSIGRYTL